MYSYKGKTALITGASSGIGEAFARSLAARGMNTVLIARTEERLNALAHELQNRYNVRCEVIPADLSQPEAAFKVRDVAQERGLQVDLLINNAGFATYGQFEESDPHLDHQQVMVNVGAVVDMAHAFLPGMVERGEGAVINVSSRGAFHPAAYMPVYTASKSFVLMFSEALWAAYRRRGIRVLALCPGPVETRFFEVVGHETPDSRRGKDTPEAVAEAGLKALERGKITLIHGWRFYLLAQLTNRLLPRATAASLVERMLRPR